jgi:hypothetical protein
MNSGNSDLVSKSRVVNSNITFKACTSSVVKLRFGVLLVWKETADGSLGSRSLRSLQAAVKRALRDGGIEFTLGGIDLSFNEDRDAVYPSYWSQHLWLLVPSKGRDKWEPLLRSRCPPRNLVPRPVKIQPFDGNSAGFAYALKTDFVRRVSYQQIKDDGEEIRLCRNTSDQPLRVEEKLRLFAYLNWMGLAERVFLLGVRPTTTKSGISIVRIDQ